MSYYLGQTLPLKQKLTLFNQIFKLGLDLEPDNLLDKNRPLSEQSMATPGNITWLNLMTTDPELANRYYQELFPWRVNAHEAPGIGTITVYQLGDKSFGGPMALDPKYKIPSHWITYFSVIDVEKACRETEENGGKVCYKPFDIPGMGKTAILNDPNGTPFHVLAPETPNGAQNIVGSETGQICWLELMADDPRKTGAFYEKVLDWTIAEESPDPNIPYFVGKAGEVVVAGILERPKEMEPINNWLPYFLVKNLEESSEAGQKMAGKKIMGPNSIPNLGTFSLFTDPTGAYFYLFENP